MAPVEDNELTLHELLRYLWPAFEPGCGVPRWPADVFGLTAIALKRSGAYASIVSAWPPPERSGRKWVGFIRRTGGNWRKAWERYAGPGSAPLPAAVRARWRKITSANAPLSRLPPDLVCALVELTAMADEASFGAGIPDLNPVEESAFHRFAMIKLARERSTGSTLCEQLHPSRVIVLPKLHAPKGGISVRSLSHHLAAVEPSEVRPVWTSVATMPASKSLNLLLVPYPYEVKPAQFAPCEEHQAPALENMPACYGFFSYRPANTGQKLKKLVIALFESAKHVVGRIDGVIFPELAMTPRDLELLSPVVRARGAFLLAGVGAPGRQRQGDENTLELHVPLLDAPPRLGLFVQITQAKHHRWYLDKPQIVQYGLGGRLDLMRSWWESTALPPRTLSFLSMRPWLTLTPLICEDLARRDPVDDILRSVGPNLVIALLMDGPQLAQRWPSRYAMALADDPHSSVLTLTSLGMTQLCRPPGKAPSRSIAMWKDAKSPGPVELELPPNAKALVLSLANEQCEEYTADGRGDEGSTGYPVLAGVHPIT